MHYRDTFKIDEKLRSILSNVDRDEATYIMAIDVYFEYTHHVEVDFSEHDYIDKDGVVIDDLNEAKYIVIRVLC